MCELQYTVTGETPSRAPIDYCYVRPHHIAAVNSLLQNHFWPGIDSLYHIDPILSRDSDISFLLFSVRVFELSRLQHSGII